jgi:peptidoglycan/xylan/chitin deacetylase (PgdA/CDA1 family)
MNVTWVQRCFERVTPVTRRSSRLLILAYHQIGDQGLPGQVSVQHFREHLDFLSAGCRLVALSDGLQALQSRSPSQSPAVAITFDDGYRDNFTQAFPLILRYRTPATIFVATGLIAAGKYKDQPMLTTAQIREMADHGVAFGAHTVSHAILSALSPEAAASEISVSKAHIEQLTGREATAFAYPNGRAGDFTDANVSAVRACGFRCGVTTIHGANAPTRNPFLLRRIGLGDWTATELAIRMSGLVDLPIVAKQTVQALAGRWLRERRLQDVQ